jgi:hypothetical protein
MKRNNHNNKKPSQLSSGLATPSPANQGKPGAGLKEFEDPEYYDEI